MEEKRELEQTPKPRKTFGGNFTDKQIDTLTKCANEATIFAQPISKETMKSIFACNLETPLQLTNNRLLAYFFNALLMKELIRYDWQDISGENKLFSSKNGNLIKRGDLSTAKNQCLENPPKESEIIDKYINQL
jgi:hypothetical protein